MTARPMPAGLLTPFFSFHLFNWGKQKYPLASRVNQNLSKISLPVIAE